MFWRKDLGNSAVEVGLALQSWKELERLQG
jgi:hypothetical protein